MAEEISEGEEGATFQHFVVPDADDAREETKADDLIPAVAKLALVRSDGCLGSKRERALTEEDDDDNDDGYCDENGCRVPDSPGLKTRPVRVLADFDRAATCAPGLSDPGSSYGFKYSSHDFPLVSSSRFIKYVEEASRQVRRNFVTMDMSTGAESLDAWASFVLRPSEEQSKEYRSAIEQFVLSKVKYVPYFVPESNKPLPAKATRAGESIGDAAFRGRIDSLLAYVASHRDRRPEGSLERLQYDKIGFVLLFVESLASSNERVSVMGWIANALLVYQVLLNISTDETDYWVGSGAAFDLASRPVVDSMYYGGFAEYVFEAICEWQLNGCRIPGVAVSSYYLRTTGVLGSSFTEPQFYLRQRANIYDPEFIRIGMTFIGDMLQNFLSDRTL